MREKNGVKKRKKKKELKRKEVANSKKFLNFINSRTSKPKQL